MGFRFRKRRRAVGPATKHRVAYGRWAEDVGFAIVGTVDNHFARQPIGAVSCAAIVRGDGPGILGYIWFSDEEAAAGYVTRRACDPDGYNAGPVWNERLNLGYLGGEAPSQTYRSLIDENFGHRIGQIDSGSLRRIESLAELRELAAMP